MADNNFKPYQFGKITGGTQKGGVKKGTEDKTAVAIAYEPGEAAPKILATGKGKYQDNQLADTLSRLQIGDMIPPELYEAVAEILVFVDDMDRLKSKVDMARNGGRS